MNYYLEPLKKYAKFDGRARRKEYWFFFLFNFLIVLALGFIEGLFGLFSDTEESVLGNIYYLAVLLPTIAVGVRRMHDVGKSGWFLLIPIYNLILACTDGTKGSNKYGQDPKGVATQTDVSKYCSQCGAPNKIEAKFCTGCGAEMKN